MVHDISWYRIQYFWYRFHLNLVQISLFLVHDTSWYRFHYFLVRDIVWYRIQYFWYRIQYFWYTIHYFWYTMWKSLVQISLFLVHELIMTWSFLCHTFYQFIILMFPFQPTEDDVEITFNVNATSTRVLWKINEMRWEKCFSIFKLNYLPEFLTKSAKIWLLSKTFSCYHEYQQIIQTCI